MGVAVVAAARTTTCVWLEAWSNKEERKNLFFAEAIDYQTEIYKLASLRMLCFAMVTFQSTAIAYLLCKLMVLMNIIQIIL